MAAICFGTICGYLLGIRNHLKPQIWGWNLGTKLAAKNENPMKLRGAQFLLAFVCLGQMAARASNLDTIGVTLLQAVTTNVNGAGIRVGQAEAGAPNWEVNPGAVGQPTNLFTYFYGTSPYSSVSTANTFTNSLGLESGHADTVGGIFYGMSGGVATNVAYVDNYEAGTLYNYYVNQSRSITDRVVNQSFIFCNADYSHLPVSTEQQIDQQYDNYAAQYKILFVSGAGNGGPTNQAQIYPPASCYNGIGVAAYGGSSCTGPTLDNGRAKPDITAPATETSYSTPQVAGAAAVLMQAGLRGDGGSDTNSAADIRTVKALLLNGAVKPADWTNGTASPLDARYGAGVLNVFNSYKQLAGQKQTNFVSASVSVGAAHPPTGATNTIGVLSGWSFTNLTSSSSLDAVAHYYFNATNGVSNATFTATATLVWNWQQNKSSINNLHLFLYNAANSNLVAVCTSAVDNVQHLFVPKLPQGRYDLQVFKSGGATVSINETYALAFEFFSQPLNVVKSGTNIVLKWPVYPAGFVIQSTTNLAPPAVWNTLSKLVTTVTNNQNYVVLNVTNGCQFFRLRRP
jgi:hypothetical protein